MIYGSYSLINVFSLKCLSPFLKIGIIQKDKILYNSAFIEFLSTCNSIYYYLKKKIIYFPLFNKLNKITKNNNISKNNIISNIKEKEDEFKETIKIGVVNFLNYYHQINTLIKYYSKYYPKTKNEEINQLKQQLLYLKDPENYDIEINKYIKEQIDFIEKYDNSRFFKIIYDEVKNENKEMDDILKFNKALKRFNELEKLFNNQKLKLDKIEKPLDKFGNYLLDELKLLKNFFGYKYANEKKIYDELIFYKDRMINSIALNSLLNIIKIFFVKNSDNFISEMTKILEDIKNINYFHEIPKIMNTLKNIDENVLEENFVVILNIFTQKSKLLNNFISQENNNLICELMDNE